MPFAIGFRLIVHKDKGLRDAPRILARNLRGGLEGLGKRLKSSAQSRMRRDRGREEKSLTIEIKSQGANSQLTVYSALVYAFVDAYGMSRGKFPPFGPGTDLYKWAVRKVNGIPSRKLNLGEEGPRKLSHLKTRRVAAVKEVTKKRKPRKAAPLGRGTRKAARDASAKKLAFLAARSIFEKGIRPSHWNTKALDANKTRIIREITNAVSRAANEISRG